ncbi:ABC transporter ATP-binding protein [Moraxella bovis]|uniref:ATP-binding cassette domain-containing protein n=1 Tax=Moraxella bovis TaxID=476 RepID=A0AAQ2T0X7_MORBO|nr:ATP-binding cassette domain-containing protein [Moraxella bovis]AWY20210.1 ATP-binding cassette domain-containing protein [Moraxella bovis]OOR92199.1 nitrate ABC transporter ATP-binding protein [Moraxella bovis]UYZ74646.1 ATP-binding cassette domain-containing protein [Moraxella bovis]UYZ79429.1 ATP-binding cassette domain-containing protein [Moraxella bovis]UYZ87910.1 ATP-binding cassette domain-containing protein [Moraxella bovis]
MSKLILNNLHHSFENKPLFNGLSLSVGTGEVVAIVGASGVGKTTLFNIVAGLITPSDGQVRIDGVDRTGQAGFVGYMLQKDLLLPFKSVYDNITLPLTLQHLPKSAIHDKIMPLLPAFGLDELYHKYPAQLSGGQRQRVALLRTYLSNDSLMLLDEPFSALDFVTKNQMYKWFGAFQKDKELTCLIITHDIDEAIYLADKLYVLKGFPATLAHHFVIDKSSDFLQSVEYLNLKQDVLRAIQG